MKTVELEIDLTEQQGQLKVSEIMRIAVGILMFAKVLPSGTWPDFDTHIEVVPNLMRPDFPTFIVSMCESVEEQQDLGKFNDLISDLPWDNRSKLSHHFIMKKK